MKKEFTKEELAGMQVKFAEQFRTGQSVFGKGGALAVMVGRYFFRLFCFTNIFLLI